MDFDVVFIVVFVVFVVVVVVVVAAAAAAPAVGCRYCFLYIQMCCSRFGFDDV